MKNFKTKLMAIALSIICVFAVILGIKLPTAFANEAGFTHYLTLDYETLDKESYRTERPTEDTPQITVFTPGYGSNASYFMHNKGFKYTYVKNSMPASIYRTFGGTDSAVDTKAVIYKVYVSEIDEIKNEYMNNFTKDELASENVSDDDEDVGSDAGASSLRGLYKSVAGMSNGIPTDSRIVFEKTYPLGGNNDIVSDFDKNIILMFEPQNPQQSNDYVYAQLEYILDSVSYEYKLAKGVLPAYNLIGHSRGGNTNMQYALGHPFNVYRLYSMGTPYNGSAFGSAEIGGEHPFLTIADMKKVITYDGASEPDFTPGICDILNAELNESYKSFWNNNYESFRHIDFTPIGSYVSIGFFLQLFVRGKENYKNYGENKALIVAVQNALAVIEDVAGIYAYTKPDVLKFFAVTAALDVVKDVLKSSFGTESEPWIKIISNLRTINVNYPHIGSRFAPFLLLADDLFIDLDSQIALGYRGTNVQVKLMGSRDQIESGMCIEAYGVAHNLEPHNPDIIKYVTERISGEKYAFATRYVDGGCEIVGLGKNNRSGAITIPEKINNVKVVSIDRLSNNISYDPETGAGDNLPNVTSVTIPSTVQKISDYAFWGMKNLKTVNIPSNGSLLEIGENAFGYCSSLTSITIPKKVGKIGAGAFINCSGLKTFTFNSDDNATIGKFALYGTGITKAEFGEKVKDINPEIFFGCESLNEIAVAAGNARYSSENGVLYDKNKTTLLYYPEGKTETSFSVPAGVKIIDKFAFYRNKHIKSVDMRGVERMSAASFIECSSDLVLNKSAGIEVDTQYYLNSYMQDGCAQEYVNFGLSDVTMNVTDIRGAMALMVNPYRSGSFEFKVSSEMPAIFVYKIGRRDDDGRADKLETVASVLNGDFVSFELDENEEYVIFLLNTFKEEAVYEAAITQVFKDLPNEFTDVLDSGEEVIFKLEITQAQAKKYSLTVENGNLSNVEFVVYSDAFQQLFGKTITGTVKEYSLWQLHYCASGQSVYYIGVKNAKSSSVNLTLKTSNEIQAVHGDKQTVISSLFDDENKIILALNPEYSGKYLFDLTHGYQISAVVTSENANSSAVWSGAKALSENANLTGGTKYFITVTTAGKGNLNYFFGFNPQRVYLNENTVQRENSDVYYSFVSPKTGTYVFSTKNGSAFEVIGGAEEVRLEEGMRCYIKVLADSVAASDVLVILPKFGELKLNTVAHLTADVGFYGFEAMQTGYYNFSATLYGGQTFSLYNKNMYLVTSSAAGSARALLTAGEIYYARLDKDGTPEAGSINVTFEPNAIFAQNEVRIKGLHWYKFTPQFTEDYNFYALGENLGDVIVNIYDVGLNLTQNLTLKNQTASTASFTAYNVFYIEIDPVGYDDDFMFAVKYKLSLSHFSSTGVRAAEGEIYTPQLAGGTSAVYEFVPQSSGVYELRVLKNYANALTVKYMVSGVGVSYALNATESSSSDKKVYSISLVSGKTYYFEISSGIYDNLSVTIAYDYEDAVVSAIDGDGREINADFISGDLHIANVYPGERYTIGLKGKRNSTVQSIPYAMDYEVVSYNGQPVYGSMNGNVLKISENGIIDSIVIVRVRCAFNEYVALFKIKYPVAFEATVTDDENGLFYNVNADIYGGDIVEPYGVSEMTFRAVNKADGMILHSFTGSWQSVYDYTTLNYYGDVIFQCALSISYNGYNITVDLPELTYAYVSNATINDVNVNSKRLIINLQGVQTNQLKTIQINSTSPVSVINLGSLNGAVVKNLYFRINKKVTINLYNVNLEGDANKEVLYVGEAAVLNVLGTNRLVGGSGGVPAAAAHFTALTLQTNSSGILTLYGGNGSDGLDGLSGSAGANGSDSNEACGQGGNGSNGVSGNKGDNGVAGASGIIMTSLTCQGKGSLNIYGGNGGKGGTGGAGGNGGKGGAGGGAGFLNKSGTGGKGGAGGKGGNGGAGGRGGVPYTVISGISAGSVKISCYVGASGSSGNGGKGGAGGQGGLGGQNTFIGSDGNGGAGGNGGDGGDSGSVTRVTFTLYNGSVISNSAPSLGLTGVGGDGGKGGLGGHNNTDLKGANGTAGSRGNKGSVLSYTA